MLHSLLPKSDKKILCLPLLGPIADGFDDWLAAKSHTRGSRKHIICMLRQVDAYLRRRRVRDLAKLDHETPHACRRDLIKILPTTHGRCLVTPRYTQPEAEQAILLHKLQLRLPLQPPHGSSFSTLYIPAGFQL